jgi:phosphatidylserine/phosphatidylglycerophosphate/cardiolipin synthase-like enzyme
MRQKKACTCKLIFIMKMKQGRLVAESLKAAAKRNVKVYLMADGYASQTFQELYS